MNVIKNVQRQHIMIIINVKNAIRSVKNVKDLLQLIILIVRYVHHQINFCIWEIVLMKVKMILTLMKQLGKKHTNWNYQKVIPLR